MRLFVAIRLSKELEKSILGTMHEMKKAGVSGSYVPAQNLHLTVAFLGEVKDASAVTEALQTVSFKPFRLTLTDTGNFEDLIWVGMKGNQGMSAAVKTVRDTLDAAGIKYDREKFVPHITILRKATGPWKTVPSPKGEMLVSRMSLMKSEQKDGKRVYTEILAF